MELDVKAFLFSYFRNLESTVRNEETENNFLQVTLAAEDGNFCSNQRTPVNLRFRVIIVKQKFTTQWSSAERDQ